MARNPEVDSAIGAAKLAKDRDAASGRDHVTMTVAQLEAIVDAAMSKRLEAHAQRLGMSLPPLPDRTLPTLEEAEQRTKADEEAGKFHMPVETQSGWYVGPRAGIAVHQWNGGR